MINVLNQMAERIAIVLGIAGLGSMLIGLAIGIGSLLILAIGLILVSGWVLDGEEEV